MWVLLRAPAAPQMAFHLTFCFGRAGLLPPGSAVGHAAAKLLAAPASPDPGHSCSASTAVSAAAQPRSTRMARAAGDPRARPASAATWRTLALRDPGVRPASATAGGKLGARGRSYDAECGSIATACSPSSGLPGSARPPRGGGGGAAAQQDGRAARPSTAPEVHASPRPSVAPEMQALSRALYPRLEPSGWRRRPCSASVPSGRHGLAASRPGSSVQPRGPKPTLGAASSVGAVERAAADARRRALAAVLLAAFPPGLAPLAPHLPGDRVSEDLAGARAGRSCTGVSLALFASGDIDDKTPKSSRQAIRLPLGGRAGAQGAVGPVALPTITYTPAACDAPEALCVPMRLPQQAQGAPSGAPCTGCSERGRPDLGFSAAECRSAALLWQLRTAQRALPIGLQTSHELLAARMPSPRGYTCL